MNKYTQMFVEKGNIIKDLKQEKDKLESELRKIINDSKYIDEETYTVKQLNLQSEINYLDKKKTEVEIGPKSIKVDIKMWILFSILYSAVLFSFNGNILLALGIGIGIPSLVCGYFIFETKKVMKHFNSEDLIQKIDQKEQEQEELEKEYDNTKEQIRNIKTRISSIETEILELASQISNNSFAISGLSNTMKASVVELQPSDCITPSQKVLMIRRKEDKDSIN